MFIFTVSICRSQSVVYVKSKLDKRWWSYQDSLGRYNHNEFFKKYARKKFTAVKTLGEFFAVEKEIGFGAADHMGTSSDMKKGYDTQGHSIVEYELIVHLVFGNDNFEIPKYVYTNVVHKPKQRVVYRPVIPPTIVGVKKKPILPIVKDSCVNKTLVIEHWHEVGSYKHKDSIKEYFFKMNSK